MSYQHEPIPHAHRLAPHLAGAEPNPWFRSSKLRRAPVAPFFIQGMGLAAGLVGVSSITFLVLTVVGKF